MPALILKRSSRVMPGLRGTPAGMITTSAPLSASPSWSSPAGREGTGMGAARQRRQVCMRVAGRHAFDRLARLVPASRWTIAFRGRRCGTLVRGVCACKQAYRLRCRQQQPARLAWRDSACCLPAALLACVALDCGLAVDVADVGGHAGGPRNIIQGQLAHVGRQLQQRSVGRRRHRVTSGQGGSGGGARRRAGRQPSCMHRSLQLPRTFISSDRGWPMPPVSSSRGKGVVQGEAAAAAAGSRFCGTARTLNPPIAGTPLALVLNLTDSGTTVAAAERVVGHRGAIQGPWTPSARHVGSPAAPSTATLRSGTPVAKPRLPALAMSALARRRAAAAMMKSNQTTGRR